jgi:hypothetical protein
VADLPDDLERLKGIAANLRDRLARIEARIKRLEDEQWREFQKERNAALAHGGRPMTLRECLEAEERPAGVKELPHG